MPVTTEAAGIFGGADKSRTLCRERGNECRIKFLAGGQTNTLEKAGTGKILIRSIHQQSIFSHQPIQPGVHLPGLLMREIAQNRIQFAHPAIYIGQ